MSTVIIQTSRLLGLVKVATLSNAKDTMYFRRLITSWKDLNISALTDGVLATVFLLCSGFKVMS